MKFIIETEQENSITKEQIPAILKNALEQGLGDGTSIAKEIADEMKITSQMLYASGQNKDINGVSVISTVKSVKAYDGDELVDTWEKSPEDTQQQIEISPIMDAMMQR